MSKQLLIASLSLLMSSACAFVEPPSSSAVRVKGSPAQQITMRRIRVYRGPVAYITRPECVRPKRLSVPKVYGVEALAFLKNRAPLVACGRKKASIVVPAGAQIDPFVIDSIRTKTGFIVACVIGDSQPSEVVIDLECRD